MNLYKSQIALAVVAILSSNVSYSASQTNGGSTPKGKPFVEINNEIVEIQGDVTTLEEQVNQLIGDVDSLEVRMSAAESAITVLQNNELSIMAQISTIYDTAFKNGVDIKALQDSATSLQAQLDALLAQGSTNTAEIQILKDQIQDINNKIAFNASGLSGLISDLSNTKAKLAALQAEVNLMELQLATKQRIISGQCNSGEFLKKVNADGSVVCGSDQVGVSGQWEAHTVASVIPLPAGHNEQYTYSCGFLGLETCYDFYWVPAPIVTVERDCTGGFVLTNDQYSTYSGNIYVYGSQNILGAVNKYQVTAQNRSQSTSYISLQVLCSRIVP